jgi:hypothetical protein
LDRIILAPSGVLLALWTDPSGATSALRRSLLRRLPGSTTKQANIIHTRRA